jgi:dTDP-4-amino-4,6-dideoxygalactose transaminase
VSAWSVYTLRIDGNGARNRDTVRAALLDRGVETAVYYPQPLHREAVFRSALVQNAQLASAHLPNAERAASEVLSLPIFPGLSTEQRAYVIQQLRAIGGV